MLPSRPRSKSNGQPPAASFQASSTPRFFPPSHYAAAANLPSPTRSPLLPHANSRETEESVLPRTMPRFTASSSSSSADVPMAITSSPLYLLTRKLSISRTASDHNVAPTNHASTAKKNRNAQKLKDLPGLEAQLLPSLRDTIDRMTSHSPVYPSEDYFQSQPPLLSLHSAFSSPSSSPVSTPSVARSWRRLGGTSSPKSDGSRIRPPSVITPKLSQTAQPPAPPRLKSALKTPAMSTPASRSASPMKSPAFKSPGKTVRMAKSFIARKEATETVVRVLIICCDWYRLTRSDSR
jgi:hypothetical protein